MRLSCRTKVVAVCTLIFTLMQTGLYRGNIAAASVKTTKPAKKAVYASSAGGLGYNALVNTTDEAVVGQLTSLEAPRWNSRDGDAWVSNLRSDDPLAFQYRKATFKVEERLFGGKDTTLNLLFYGSGTNNPAEKDVPSDESGKLTVGERLVLLLIRYPVRWQGGREEVLLVAHEATRGIWHIRDEQALSDVPNRSTQLSVLLQSLRYERSIGLQKVQGLAPFEPVPTTIPPRVLPPPVQLAGRAAGATPEVLRSDAIGGSTAEILANDEEYVWHFTRAEEKTPFSSFGVSRSAVVSTAPPVGFCVSDKIMTVLAVMGHVDTRPVEVANEVSRTLTSGQLRVQVFISAGDAASKSVVRGPDAAPIVVPCRPPATK